VITVDYMDLGLQSKGTEISVAHNGGSAYVELITADNFRLLQADSDYQCVYSQQLNNGQFTYSVPADDHWYVVAIGDGTLAVDLMLGANVPVPLPTPGGEFGLPSDPSSRHNPAVPSVDVLNALLNRKPAAAQDMSWSDLVEPGLGLTQKYIDGLRSNFFIDGVHPVDFSAVGNPDGSTAFEVRMSDGSTLRLTIGRKYNTIPMLGGLPVVVENPGQQPQAHVEASPLFGNAYLYDDGTFLSEKQQLDFALDVLGKLSDIASLVPMGRGPGTVGKLSIAGIRKAIEATSRTALETNHGADVKEAFTNEIRNELANQNQLVGRRVQREQSGTTGHWNPALNKPEKNTEYVVDGGKYVYETDENGWVVRVEIHLSGPQAPKPRQSSPQVPGKLPGDQFGHLAPAVLGGPGENINLTAQTQNNNLSVVRKIENQWGKIINANIPLDAEIEIARDATGRPTLYHYSWTDANGQPEEQDVPN
jgi:hypothetical protein